MLEQIVEVHIAGLHLRDRPAQLGFGTRLGIRDLPCVNGIACELAHLLIGEWALALAVERQQSLARAETVLQCDAGRVGELFGNVGRTGERHVELAGFEVVGHLLLVRVIAQRRLRGLRLVCPIVFVAGELDGTRLHRVHDERAGAVGMVCEIGVLRIRVHDGAGLARQCGQEARVRRGERERD